MIYYVDIDDTVFSLPYKGSTEYDKHIPMPERIAHFNTLFDQGHEIYYFTARGTRSGIDWFDVTKKQLQEWGCKWHGLSVGIKPDYDLLICDKTKRIEEI